MNNTKEAVTTADCCQEAVPPASQARALLNDSGVNRANAFRHDTYEALGYNCDITVVLLWYH